MNKRTSIYLRVTNATTISNLLQFAAAEGNFQRQQQLQLYSLLAKPGTLEPGRA